MTPFLVFLAATAVLLLLFTGEALAQRVMRLVHRSRYVPGEVLSIGKTAYGPDRHYGMHLRLKTAEGELTVHLGPSWFVNSQRVRLAPHDRIEVTGSRVSYEGEPALIASRIRKGHESLRLRAPDGSPLWHGSAAG